MSDKNISISKATGRKSERILRALKVTAAALAVIYTINGAGMAIGYANALQMGSGNSVQQFPTVAWVGVTWPLVLDNMLRTDTLERVEPVSKPSM